MNEPLFQITFIGFLVILPIINYQLSKIKLKYIFYIPLISLIIALPIFIFVIIVGINSITKYLFFLSMILWNSGFCSLFISWIIYKKKKKITTN